MRKRSCRGLNVSNSKRIVKKQTLVVIMSSKVPINHPLTWIRSSYYSLPLLKSLRHTIYHIYRSNSQVINKQSAFIHVVPENTIMGVQPNANSYLIWASLRWVGASLGYIFMTHMNECILLNKKIIHIS